METTSYTTLVAMAIDAKRDAYLLMEHDKSIMDNEVKTLLDLRRKIVQHLVSRGYAVWQLPRELR